MIHSPKQPEIIHGIPGRLRIRVPSLQVNPDFTATLESQIKATPAVETVRISVATDSIIINYRPENQASTGEKIYQRIRQITQEFFAPVTDVNPPVEAKISTSLEREMPSTQSEGIPPVIGSTPEPTVELSVATDTKTELVSISEPTSEPQTDAQLPEDLASETLNVIESEPIITHLKNVIDGERTPNSTPSAPTPEDISQPPAATTPPAQKQSSAKTPTRRSSPPPRKPRTRKKPGGSGDSWF